MPTGIRAVRKGKMRPTIEKKMAGRTQLLALACAFSASHVLMSPLCSIMSPSSLTYQDMSCGQDALELPGLGPRAAPREAVT